MNSRMAGFSRSRAWDPETAPRMVLVFVLRAPRFIAETPGPGAPDSAFPQDPLRFETILSGDLNGDDGPGFTNRFENAYHVLYTQQPSGSLRWLSNCTVQGGNANGIGQHRNGGGVHINLTPLHLGKCLFQDNEAAGSGGGVYIASGTPGGGGYTMSQNTFTQATELRRLDWLGNELSAR